MDGFVRLDDDRARAASDAAWRATLIPPLEYLPDQAESRDVIEQVVRGGRQYLDLCRAAARPETA